MESREVRRLGSAASRVPFRGRGSSLSRYFGRLDERALFLRDKCYRHSVQSGTEAPVGSCKTFGLRIPLIRQFGSRVWLCEEGGFRWRRQGVPLHVRAADGARPRQGRGAALHRRQRGEGGCAIGAGGREGVARCSAQGKAPAPAASSHRSRRQRGSCVRRRACGRGSLESRRIMWGRRIRRALLLAVWVEQWGPVGVVRPVRLPQLLGRSGL